MTKEQMMNRFADLTNNFKGFESLIKKYAKRMTKEECKKLMTMAEDGYTEFRIFLDHGYALDKDYNRIWIYDHRRK